MAVTKTIAPKLPPVAGSGRHLIDVDAAAAKADCSPRHWLRLCDAGLAPWGCKLGSLRRWDASELDAWIAGGCNPVRDGGEVASNG